MPARDPYNRREGGTVASYARRLAGRAQGVSATELASAAFVDRNTAAATLSQLSQQHLVAPLCKGGTARGQVRYFVHKADALAYVTTLLQQALTMPQDHTRPPQVARKRTAAPKRPPAVAPGVTVPKPDVRPTAPGEMVMTPRTKVTVAPTPVDTRYVVTGPIVGGFGTEWAELRRYGEAGVLARRAAARPRKCAPAAAEGAEAAPTPSTRSARA